MPLQDLRAHFKQLRAQAASRREDVASQILEQLKPRLTVPTLSFCSLEGEILMSAVNNYLEERGLLILPRIEGSKLALHYKKGALIKNRWGIEEPSEQDPLGQPFLALIPGLAFDKVGQRLGYGKGFYDRLLTTRTYRTIGLAFKEQLVERLPAKAHDQPVDLVLTF